MLLRVGKNRFVFIFPRLCLAVKFPVVHLVWAVRQFFLHGFRNPYPEDPTRSLAALFFKGMGDNWREYRFYRETRHPFCQPTYFSLFGLVNLQRAGRPCEHPSQVFWSEVQGATAGAVFKDAHHFSNLMNFCHDHTTDLKILDYGHPKTQDIIRQYGRQLSACRHATCPVQ